MKLALILLKQNVRSGLITRTFASGQVIFNKQTINPVTNPVAAAIKTVPDVKGLSEAVLTTHEPVGPGASKAGEYKVPEYFNYNKTSYFEAEVEMAKYRCPQPSADMK